MLKNRPLHTQSHTVCLAEQRHTRTLLYKLLSFVSPCSGNSCCAHISQMLTANTFPPNFEGKTKNQKKKERQNPITDKSKLLWSEDICYAE